MKRSGSGMAWGLAVLLGFSVMCGEALGQGRGGRRAPGGFGMEVGPALEAKLKLYETPYYIIHSDLDAEKLKEVMVRSTTMFETYRDRMKDFGGRIDRKLPFYVFSDEADYRQAGGIPGLGGMFIWNRLMVVAEASGEADWDVVQREGFRQFAAQVMRGDIPVWLSEGLAEYFGEGIWTGDGYVTGVIPAERLGDVQGQIRGRKMLAVRSMMDVSMMEWISPNGARNPDEVWALVHYLAHGDGGKYQKGFSALLSGLGRGQSFEKTWVASFGSDIDGFEKACWAWWLAQPSEGTREKGVEATVQTLTSTLARATSMGQEFADAQAFLEACGQKDGVKSAPEQWLPESLLTKAVEDAKKLSEWSLGRGKTGKTLVLKTEDGTEYTGMFRVSGKKIVKVWVEVKKREEGAKKE